MYKFGSEIIITPPTPRFKNQIMQKRRRRQFLSLSVCPDKISITFPKAQMTHRFERLLYTEADLYRV